LICPIIEVVLMTWRLAIKNMLIQCQHIFDRPPNAAQS